MLPLCVQPARPSSLKPWKESASRALLATAIIVGGASTLRAEILFSVTFDDSGEFDPVRSMLEANVLAAGRLWNDVLEGDALIEVVVRASDSTPGATGRSLTSVLSGRQGSFEIREEGMAYEVRTGIDPNGSDPDIEINLNPDRAVNGYWYDPDGYSRTAPLPADRTDGMSIMLHEIGHGLLFNGWMDTFTGEYPGKLMSRFDSHKVFDGDNFYFTGPEAMQLYGGPVPLTYGNSNHLGNASPRPGAALLPDLMNGVVFKHGTRYSISSMDLAIARDVGLRTIEPPQAPAGSILGDRFELALQAYYYRTGEGWQYGQDIGEGGLLTDLAFGQPTEFDLLGNTLVVNSAVEPTSPTEEQWTVSLTAADGGLIFDPANAGAWRAMHLRELAVGGFSTDGEGGLRSDNFLGFLPAGEEVVSSLQSLLLIDDQGNINTLQLDASATFGEISFGASFENPGLILFDDGVFNADDLRVTEIQMVLKVSVVASAMAGNYNGDGAVDIADYTAWRDSLGRGDGGRAADGDRDGAVTIDDYLIWKNNFGAQPASTNAHQVPEPMALALALASLLAMISRL